VNRRRLTDWLLLLGVAVAFLLLLVAMVAAALIFAPLEPAVQGAIAGGLIAGFFTLIASNVALYVQRRLREQGEVVCQVSSDWIRGSPRSDAGETRDFRVRFRNEKDVSVTLWDFYAEFSKEGEELTSFEPTRVEPTRVDGSETAEVEPVNLLPREAIYIDMTLAATGDDLQRVKEADKVELVMTVAGGEEKRKELPLWNDQG
jgi:hypothetical protein